MNGKEAYVDLGRGQRNHQTVSQPMKFDNLGAANISHE